MKSKLLIVTDLGLLKAYKAELRDEGSPRLILLEELVLESAHQHLTEQITDSAGRRAAHAGNAGGGSMAKNHNLELEAKRRLIKTLAQKITELASLSPKESCWLAAHKEIMHPVLEALPQAVRLRIEKQVPLDLTKLEPKAVMDRFLAV
jgi:hypothetical protein